MMDPHRFIKKFHYEEYESNFAHEFYHGLVNSKHYSDICLMIHKAYQAGYNDAVNNSKK